VVSIEASNSFRFQHHHVASESLLVSAQAEPVQTGRIHQRFEIEVDDGLLNRPENFVVVPCQVETSP